MDRERSATATQIEGLQIEASLLRRDLGEQQDLLARATVRVDRPGVVTFVADEEGAMVREGAVVARVADLSRFRVEASLSDVHATRVAVGMPVRVVANEHTLSGRVSSIPPAMDKGLMTLEVSLDEPSSPWLRANLRVDAYVVTEQRRGVLRIAKGPFVNGSGEQEVFVLRGDEAYRTRARIGVAGIDHYEVVSGLEEGERVIVSSMADYQHLEQVRVRGASRNQ